MKRALFVELENEPPERTQEPKIPKSLQDSKRMHSTSDHVSIPVQQISHDQQTSSQIVSEYNVKNWQYRVSANNLVYFYNSVTHHSTWAVPRCLIPHSSPLSQILDAYPLCSLHITGNGQRFFSKRLALHSSWVPIGSATGPNSESLSPWSEYVAPSGHLYYYNSESNKSSWKPPADYITNCIQRPKILNREQVQVARQHLHRISKSSSSTHQLLIPRPSGPPPASRATDLHKNIDTKIVYHNTSSRYSAFYNLLSEKIINPSTSWPRAIELIKDDERYFALNNPYRREHCFHQFMVQKRKNLRNQLDSQSSRARSLLFELFNSIKPKFHLGMTFNQILPWIENDWRFHSIIDPNSPPGDEMRDALNFSLPYEERAKIFEDFLSGRHGLFRDIRDPASDIRRLNIIYFTKMLEICEPPITHDTSYSEAIRRLRKMHRSKFNDLVTPFDLHEYVTQKQNKHSHSPVSQNSTIKKFKYSKLANFNFLIDPLLAYSTLPVESSGKIPTFNQGLIRYCSVDRVSAYQSFHESLVDIKNKTTKTFAQELANQITLNTNSFLEELVTPSIPLWSIESEKYISSENLKSILQLTGDMDISDTTTTSDPTHSNPILQSTFFKLLQSSPELPPRLWFQFLSKSILSSDIQKSMEFNSTFLESSENSVSGSSTNRFPSSFQTFCSQNFGADTLHKDSSLEQKRRIWLYLLSLTISKQREQKMKQTQK